MFHASIILIACIMAMSTAEDCFEDSCANNETSSMQVTMLQKRASGTSIQDGQEDETTKTLKVSKATCEDKHEGCNGWAQSGECTKNVVWMSGNCELACGICEDRSRSSNPCDVNEIINSGDSASFYLYNKFHNEYMSTDGTNADLYHKAGSHATWHFKHASGHTNNRFYISNDWKRSFLSSSGDYNHDNVQLWGGGGRGEESLDSHKELEWLVFTANELTNGAPTCTFYIMHSDSHKWLDTHGDNVHIWGDTSDIFELGDAPANMQWELHMVSGRH